MTALWLALSIGFEVGATLSLRASDGFRKRLWLVPIAVGYVASFMCLGFTLRAGMPVGVAYSIWTAVGLVAISLLARAIWNDPLNRRMAAGIALLILGVVLIELG